MSGAVLPTVRVRQRGGKTWGLAAQLGEVIDPWGT